MTLCYRGVKYEMAQTAQPQPISVTSITLIYRGNPYQLNSSESGNHRFAKARLQNSFHQPATVKPQLTYRGASYIASYIASQSLI